MTLSFFRLEQAVAAARERWKEAAALRVGVVRARAWGGWRALAEEARDVRLLKEVTDGATADRFAHGSVSLFVKREN